MLSLDRPSLSLGRLAGIPIRIHWTFSLFLVFIGYIAYSNEIPREHLFGFLSYVVLLFVFVIMHEYGHALAARKFGINTRDIIISPIGGIARLERIPEEPRHELLIAIAGPAVNAVLAIVLLITQLLFAENILPQNEQINFSSFNDFMGYLLILNVILVVFNMIPAFPMDGGRVLRSLLNMIVKDRLIATRWAVYVGQLIAIGFIFLGIWLEQNYMLIFIGIFVFVTARSEYRQMKLVHRMSKTYLRDILRTQFTILKETDLIESVLMIKDEKNFLVADRDDRIIGALPDLLIKKMTKNRDGGNLYVSELMTNANGVLLENTSLKDAFESLNVHGWVIAEVIDAQGYKTGVIDRQLLIDFIEG